LTSFGIFTSLTIIESPAAFKREISIEIEDDTPVQDRNREPLPKEVVEDLEKDELEDYSEKVKIRLKQMKKTPG